MSEKIKWLLREMVSVKPVNKTAQFILNKCLPNSVFLKLKRWVSLKIYKVDFIHPNNKLNKQKGWEPIFHIIPPLNQRKKVDLVICCAFKGRHEVLEQSIMESLFQKGDYHVEWFICGSTEEDIQFIQKIAAKTGKVSGMVWNNNPLGEKWSFCVTTAGDLYDAELYAITGSDDILSSSLIHTIISKHRGYLSSTENTVTQEKHHLPAMYCTNKWVVLRLGSQGQFPTTIACGLKDSDYYVPLGAGRFYSKQFMQEVNFNIFDIKRENCLDDYGYYKTIELGYRLKHYDLDDGLLVSVKGNWQQMNLVEDILNADSIQTKDCTFSMLDKFKEEISPEIFAYLFKPETSTIEYAWA